jgi:large subunit ribosomal protein L18
MSKTSEKTTARLKRVRRIRKKISGISTRPRMTVFRSNKHIYAQIIDDSQHKTLVSMSTLDKHIDIESGGKKSGVAKQVGTILAERALAVGITKVVFDRSGYIYHGRIKALSDGAREGGLIF